MYGCALARCRMHRLVVARSTACCNLAILEDCLHAQTHWGMVRSVVQRLQWKAAAHCIPTTLCKNASNSLCASILHGICHRHSLGDLFWEIVYCGTEIRAAICDAHVVMELFVGCALASASDGAMVIGGYE